MSAYWNDFWDKHKARPRLSVEAQKKLDETQMAEQRQRIVNYKKFFGEDHGRQVMLDLMNKYYVLTPLPETADPVTLARAEGNREVVLDLLKRANVSMEQLDKILKGEFV